MAAIMKLTGAPTHRPTTKSITYRSTRVSRGMERAAMPTITDERVAPPGVTFR
jgi:hypothetical protein